MPQIRSLRTIISVIGLLLSLCMGRGTLAADVLEPHDLPGYGTVRLPPGFSISIYATGLGNPRFMGVRPSDGTLFVAVTGGNVYAVTGPGAMPQLFASGLQMPSSVAFRGDYVYVGETNEIIRYHAANNALMPDGPKEVVIPDLPPGGYHWTRTVAFGPDDKLYVAIGSTCEACIEEDSRRGAISVFDPDGSNGRPYATGMRNPVALAWQPGTNQLWTTVNGNDALADVTDEVHPVNDGDNYGWPWCYNGRVPNPTPDFNDPARCMTVPDNVISVGGHVTPLGLTFGDKFAAPTEYQNSIYVAEHGGFQDPGGYKVIRIPLVDGKPGQPQEFATGWWVSSTDVWGRPVGVTIGADGAMYVSDDQKGVIYRIAATS